MLTVFENREGQEWTSQEEKVLRSLILDKDFTYRTVSELMGRTESSIRGKVAQEEWFKGKKKKKLGEVKSHTKFRTPKIWGIKNRILYGLLLAEDIKLSELAEMINVNSRTVQGWCFEGTIPNQENKDKVCEILNVPEYILFGDYAIKN